MEKTEQKIVLPPIPSWCANLVETYAQASEEIRAEMKRNVEDFVETTDMALDILSGYSSVHDCFTIIDAMLQLVPITELKVEVVTK